MKKIILTVTAVVFAALAAQAQSAGVEARMASTAFRGLVQPVKQTPKKGSTAAAQKQQNLASGIERQVTKAVAKQQTPKTTVAPAKTNKAKQWLKAIFLGGPLPGESAEKYQTRLVAQSQPASLPFK